MTDQNKAAVVTADELREQLRNYDRTPFLDVLETWLRSAPSGDAIALMAGKNPAQWAGAIIGLARMAGFTERREVEHTGTINMRQMSDAEIELRLLDATRRMGLIEEAQVVPEK